MCGQTADLLDWPDPISLASILIFFNNCYKTLKSVIDFYVVVTKDPLHGVGLVLSTYF